MLKRTIEDRLSFNQEVFLANETFLFHNAHMRIGEVLKGWRVAHELTLRQAAVVLGVPFQTLARIEKGSAIDGRTLTILFHFLFG